MQSMKVMTLNLRVVSSKDGINRMENRTEKIKHLLIRESPDLIGFQEASKWVWDWLEQTLSDEYLLIGCGRESDYTGEGTPIAFRKKRFQLLGMECFWLSDTPMVPGSRYALSDQSRWPRVAVSCFLKERESGNLLTFLNTHTDNIGSASRTLAMHRLADALQNKPGKLLLTGDLNALPESDEIQLFLRETKERGLYDASDSTGGTFHGFGTLQEPRKIDYIFTDLRSVSCYAAEEHPDDGVFYSDHFAVCAELEWS